MPTDTFPIYDDEYGETPKKRELNPADFITDPKMVEVYNGMKRLMDPVSFGKLILGDGYEVSPFSLTPEEYFKYLVNKSQKSFFEIVDSNDKKRKGEESEKNKLSEIYNNEHYLKLQEIIAGFNEGGMSLEECEQSYDEALTNLLEDFDKTYQKVIFKLFNIFIQDFDEGGSDDEDDGKGRGGTINIEGWEW